MKYDVVIVAAGKGNRANLGYNKVFFKMANNKTVLENSCELFINDDDCQNIIVVTNKDDFDKVIKNKKISLVEGGKERKDSVKNGLSKVESEYVLIHDAARPYLHISALNDVKKAVEEKQAVILAHVAVDGVKIVDGGKIGETIDKHRVYLAETPQAFKTDILRKCYEKCDDYNYQDDSSLVEKNGYNVYIVEDNHNNIKLTYKEDFIHD